MDIVCLVVFVQAVKLKTDRDSIRGTISSRPTLKTQTWRVLSDDHGYPDGPWFLQRTLRDRKKDEFMALEQGGMSVAAYEAKFYTLSRYATQLVTTKEEKIRLFIRGLNSKLQVLFVHMTSAGRSFNEVTDFVKKVEGVRQDGQAKTLAKMAKNSGNFQGSYSKGSEKPTLAAKPIQSVMPISIGNYSGSHLII
ncbi:hypothetical protein MTR67_002165 [Solanum verrucosum]|uniref:Retrotransposon gag domain-containing protein n=1 Tax=Solanum verrucosum TaxID=315347 RepID=A0AAF0PRV8_SOLVR|nr:hypothetical protein MTR67_002165 [Solanum verrucosum]